jgi:hypothetical protein
VTLPRRLWHELPPSVRLATERGIGQVVHVQPVATGSVTDLAAVLHAGSGRYFCKGIETSNPRAWMHRNEARLNAHLPPGVPSLRLEVEQDGWLLLFFDHVDGRHPDLSPGSPDLPALAEALAEMAASLTPCPLPQVQPATARWAGRIDPSLIDGDTLAHTDMTPRNFLIRGSGMSIVDWSTPCRGAGWLDTALMLIRLVRAGHTVAQAETWAAAVPVWNSAPPAALDGFAVALARLRRERARQSSAEHLAELAKAAVDWAQHRSPAHSA